MTLNAEDLVDGANEDDARGRLPDGRAFRTDTEGVQLVDYIAELELSIEELNRKITGLESELKDKDASITRIKKGESLDAELIKEKDLVDNVKTRDVDLELQKSFECSKPAAVTPVFDLSKCPSVNDQDKNGYASEIRSHLEQSLRDYEVKYQQAKSLNDEYTKRIADLTKALDSSQAKLENSKLELIKVRATQKGPSQYTEATDSSSKDSSDRYARLRDNFDSTVASSNGYASNSRTRVLVPETITAGRGSRPQFATAQKMAVMNVKSSVVTEFNKLRALVASRDSQFSTFKNTNQNNVQFKLSSLFSSRGLNLQGINTQISQAGTVSELSYLLKDIREIKGKVEDDIALINRMKRVG